MLTKIRQYSTVVVHPTCNRKVAGSNPATGLYCTFANLLSLAKLLVYWLSTGISFDIACETLKQLREKELELFISGQGKAVYVVVITG